MGCVESKAKITVGVSTEDSNNTKNSYVEEISDYSSYGDMDLDRSILPTLSEAINEIRQSKTPSPPSSQSVELAIDPLKPAPLNDEERVINGYIKSAVEYRNEHGGKCDLQKQLRMRRLEVICVGAFIQLNNSTNKYDILSYDTFIPNTNMKYRPDLILQDLDTNMIVHVEIDEKAHSGYDPIAEEARENEIAKHFKKFEYMCIRFNPNKYSNKLEMAVKFAQLLNSNDGIIYVKHRKRIIT